MSRSVNWSDAIVESWRCMERVGVNPSARKAMEMARMMGASFRDVEAYEVLSHFKAAAKVQTERKREAENKHDGSVSAANGPQTGRGFTRVNKVLPVPLPDTRVDTPYQPESATPAEGLAKKQEAADMPPRASQSNPELREDGPLPNSAAPSPVPKKRREPSEQELAVYRLLDQIAPHIKPLLKNDQTIAQWRKQQVATVKEWLEAGCPPEDILRAQSELRAWDGRPFFSMAELRKAKIKNEFPVDPSHKPKTFERPDPYAKIAARAYARFGGQ